MVEHFTAFRDIPFDAFTGEVLYPPVGWYFEEIVSVEGNNSPYSHPQAVENWTTGLNGLTRVVGERMLNVPGLSVNLHFRHDQISVQPGISETTLNGFQKVFIVVRVRPTSSFVSKRFDDFDQENLNLIVTQFWSVKAGTNSPSMREEYFPAINVSDSMHGLHKQNKALKEIGHELIVRYYEHV